MLATLQEFSWINTSINEPPERASFGGSEFVCKAPHAVCLWETGGQRTDTERGFPRWPTAIWREARTTSDLLTAQMDLFFKIQFPFALFSENKWSIFNALIMWFSLKKGGGILRLRITKSPCKFIMIFTNHWLWVPTTQTGLGGKSTVLVRNRVTSLMSPPCTRKAIVLTILSLHKTNFKTTFSFAKSTYNFYVIEKQMALTS